MIIHCVFEDDAVRISSVKRSRTMSITIVRSLPSSKKSIFRQVHYTPHNSLQLEAAQAKEVLLIVHRI